MCVDKEGSYRVRFRLGLRGVTTSTGLSRVRGISGGKEVTDGLLKVPRRSTGKGGK